jgi:hypothetical protein
MSENFNEYSKPPCNCQKCNYSQPIQPTAPSPLLPQAEKLCAWKELYWYLDPDNGGRKKSEKIGMSDKIPFDQVCRNGKSVFLQEETADIVILKDSVYCIKFKARAVMTDLMEEGMARDVTISVMSTLRGSIGFVTATKNAQPVELCVQAFLRAGEIIYLKISHEKNTETKLKDYKVCVELMDDCNKDCCGDLKDKIKPCEKCDGGWV